MIAYARHAVGYLYTRKSAAVIERPIVYARYASVSRYDAIITSQYKCFIIRFYKTISCAVIFCIVFCYNYTRKSATFFERPIAYARYAIGYLYTRKSATDMERMIAYARYAISYRYAIKFATELKRTIAYACNR